MACLLGVVALLYIGLPAILYKWVVPATTATNAGLPASVLVLSYVFEWCFPAAGEGGARPG